MMDSEELESNLDCATNGLAPKEAQVAKTIEEMFASKVNGVWRSAYILFRIGDDIWLCMVALRTPFPPFCLQSPCQRQRCSQRTDERKRADHIDSHAPQ